MSLHPHEQAMVDKHDRLRICWADAEYIRELYYKGYGILDGKPYSTRRLANEYRVSQKTIHDIIKQRYREQE